MKKRICMVAYTNYITDARVRREAETLASLPGYSVTVLALTEGDSPRTYLHEGAEVRELGIRKYRGKSNVRYFLSYLGFMFRAFSAINRLLLKDPPDVIHVHNMPNFIVFSAIIPFLFGKKIILDIHDTMVETYAVKFDGNSNGFLHGALRFEEKVSCALAHKIICVNHVQRSALVKRGISREKIEVSINVPDPRIFNRRKEAAGRAADKGAFKLVYHGTVAKRLSVDMAIRAVAALKGKIPGMEFYVLGDGDDKEEFIALCEELKIQEFTHFRKRVPFEDMIRVLVEMDLEIVPNRRNVASELMLPVKLLDCIALGIPVVAPRLKTIEYYFTDDMVFYFEPDDEESLACAILNAYRDETVRMRKAENARVFLHRYGWETHKYGLIDTYRSL